MASFGAGSTKVKLTFNTEQAVVPGINPERLLERHLRASLGFPFGNRCHSSMLDALVSL